MKKIYSDKKIESKTHLVEYFVSGCKPKKDWRIGTEHEKFGFKRKNLEPIGYFGKSGINSVLKGMFRFDWNPIFEGENIVALKKGNQSITLEPGGQLELSGAPLETLHETCNEVNLHLSQIKEVADELGIGFLNTGFNPKDSIKQISLMPKSRYKIMKEYMPKKGAHGLDMMFRSSTVQANLDYQSEKDMIKKMKVAFSFQPIVTALFANSPFVDGKDSGYQSYRSFVWTKTDPDRCGILQFVFEEEMSFERYTDYALDVPMYFVYRDGKYIDVSGESFRDFLKGNLSAIPGEKPLISDWENHLSTLFPEVRLKKFIEMRGADGGPWSRLCALPALWVGLLYDDSSLEMCSEICKDFSYSEVNKLRNDVPLTGLNTNFRKNLSVHDIAGQLLDIARSGLKSRAKLDSIGNDETGFLDILFSCHRKNENFSEILLKKYKNEWNNSVVPAYKEEIF